MYADIFSCADKTAVVTGGCGLIGREIVQGLEQHGADVYVADRHEEPTCRFKGPRTRYLQLDISSESSVKNLIKQVVAQMGKVDILVNCAYPRTDDWGQKIEEVGFDSWKANVDQHLGGYFLMCREAAVEMKRGGGGSIINLASIYGIVAPDFSLYEGTEMTMPVAYASIKAGIIALTRYIATYYGPCGVRANTVSPGGIFDRQPPAFVQRYSAKTPLGRMGNPGEVVGAVLYLASDASSFVTGHDLAVDGGWTAW